MVVSKVLKFGLVFLGILFAASLVSLFKATASPAVNKPYDWVSYYGNGNLDKLSQFSLIDLDADNYSAADIANLKSSGSTVVSYLNIGSCETFRSYWNQCAPYSIGSYQGWPGEYWMDASNPGWRDLVVNTLAPRLFAKGVEGLYLDNIELFQQFPGRPDISAGIVDIVYRLRAKYPDKIIIAQNGLDIFGDTGPDGRQFWQYLDAEAHEEVNSTYDPYRAVNVSDSNSLINDLAGWKARGLPIYTLDYSGGDSSLAAYDYQRSLANGFHPYAASKNLDVVYFWSFGAGSFAPPGKTGAPPVTSTPPTATAPPATPTTGQSPGQGASSNVKYCWTLYDDVAMRSWLLASSPSGQAGSLQFNLTIGGKPQSMPAAFGPSFPTPSGQAVTVPGGETIAGMLPGVAGGPVTMTSLTGSKAVVSQRILFGNSLEEVSGTQASHLSSDYWWAWYDSASAGFKNWIIVENPGSSNVYYKISIAGVTRQSGTLAPGGEAAPVFNGLMGGPVRVQAWSDKVNGKSPVSVLASQRVISGNGGAFNEVPGIPDSDLSNDYLWTWYDDGGGRNWILIGNPTANSDGSNNTDSLYYTVTIGGKMVDQGGPVAPGQMIAPAYTGWIGGPVEVKTYLDAGHTTPKRSIAFQRVIWGPSFEEVAGSPRQATPGDPGAGLATRYNWTWYDQGEGPGVRNWVLVGNPNSSKIYYEISVAGVVRAEGKLVPGQLVEPTFNGLVGGPVEVDAWTDGSKAKPQPVIASQRVLWNGFFNETLGTNLG